jgi:hypothetical protein
LADSLKFVLRRCELVLEVDGEVVVASDAAVAWWRLAETVG